MSDLMYVNWVLRMDLSAGELMELDWVLEFDWMG